MKFNRVWAMPNKNTFSIPPIKRLLSEYVKDKTLWADGFANISKVAGVTNDLNPEFDTTFHLDALDFYKQFNSNSFDGVLYDPPYSLRQVVEVYKGFGVPVTQETTQSSWRSRHIDEISRIVKLGGVSISFGWNSAGVGKTRGFEIIEILLVAHGGSKNDTIVTVERKIK